MYVYTPYARYKYSQLTTHEPRYNKTEEMTQ